ncbi:MULTISPECIES: TonB-dependent siderophore receptor [Methylobacterium]|uniref:Ferrichrome outer membrane transporter/phage receptor n=2 Tax=Pseudomonadota TaxID=1224 RepID=A0ABQ4SXM2_9HYPH|nr:MULTISPECIES: TonB-dependent siderophore receptor [Methylobacterium]PIU07999.1 MAG: TonB-dependent siderophore receptor [Methylobacterium sp. CG09_land_8_20_14_0_10_71_15]PIU15793.1 MAG: TonB-dependent siderophore receptor [Methylobacterium sp. CG08_land_8_20_14_0_20_71_15]GBU17929.1 ferrichrome outer membrane transporter [Methylobacterium sp.]GJE07965.1 Ferrichrome outer membrane transporter/phage receptor [Methylobacterium jeotgali]
MQTDPSFRRFLRRAALSSASLLAMAVAASAQDATPPQRGTANPPAQAGAATLSEIAVEGTAVRAARPGGVAAGRFDREDPRGPVDGYVATRSATATKTDTPLIETPQAITVIGRQQIDAQGATTLTQATQYTAGIYSGVFGADQRVDFFTLRGFTASDYGIYKDGLQLLNFGFGTYKVETFGLERIEVLRGPSAVLFGAGNPGGLVNQITKRPTTLPFGSIEVGGGSFGQAYGAFDIGGPADNSGHWFYRLTGIGRTGGTQVDGVPADRYYIAPALTYKPDGGTSFTVLTSYQRDSTGVTSLFLPYSGTARPNASGFRIPRSLNIGDPTFNNFQREQAYAGYEFEHAVDNVWTVRQNFRYSLSDGYQNSYIGQIGYANAAQTQLARNQFAFQDKASLFQVDNQAEARFFDGLFGHTVIFGVDYKNYLLKDNQAFAGGPALDLLAPTFGPAQGRPSPYIVRDFAFSQVGLYAQDQIKLTDRLSLIGGLRQDFATTDTNVRYSAFGDTSSSRNDQALTGRIALLYNFDFGFAPYVAYSTSFQPQIGQDALNGFRSLRPDRGEQIEVGARLEPVGAGYSLQVAAFDLVRDNPPFSIPGTFNTTQQGSVRSRGVEAQFVGNLFDGLNLVAAVTHYDLEYVKSQAPVLIGKTPTNVPQTFASAFLDYTIPVGELRGFGFGGGVRYVGSSFADQLNTLRVPEYVLFDATVHYTWDRWRAAITAANIGDRRFVSACQDPNNCFYGEARRVMASVSYKW